MDRIIEKKRGLQKKHLPYLIGGVVVITCLLWLAVGRGRSTLVVKATDVTISTVVKGEFKDYVRLNGTVVPIQVVQISPEEGGIVCEKVAEEGQTVRKGDVIVRLSNSNLDLQILNAEAELAEKQNLLRNTQVAMQQDRLNNETELASLKMDVVRKRRAFEQNDRLFQEKLISRETFLQAREDYELAVKKQELIGERLKKDAQYRSIQMEQMEDNLANMQRNLVLVRERKGKLEVRSAIDGELGLLDVELGQSIAAGAMIGQINDLSDYKIEAQVDEHYIDRVKVGLQATFERDNRQFVLTVRKVYPEVRQGKFRTDLIFTGSRPANIRTGQTYYLNLELGHPETATMIPRGTFFQATGGNWVYVLDKNGQNAYRRNIRIGRQNPRYYEVEEGLEPGEKIIVSGYEAFNNNEVLRLK